jgi:hypothetical protein
MKYRKYFKKVIVQKYPETGDAILLETESLYLIISKDTNFSKISSNPIDKRLDFTAYFLAFIQVLDKRGVDYESIKSTCLEITYEFVRPKNELQKWLKRLPLKLLNSGLASPLIKILDRKINRKGYVDGFVAKIITDKKETYGLGYGFDILECGICKLFKKHNADKYSSILCEVDKFTSSLAGLELVRKGTIANGAEKCDFRFKKKQTIHPNTMV